MEEGQNGGGEGQGAGGEGAAGAGGAGGEGQGQAGGHEKFVPYERFQEVNTRYKDLETKQTQMQSVMDQLRGALSPEQKKGFKLDYSNPDRSIEDFVNSTLKERMESMKKEGAERESTQQRQSAIKWFQSQEDYTPELEEKAAAFIKENSLQGMDPEKVIKLAYKFVTMGDGSGYTRQVKEGLRKPGAGGKGKEFDAKAELAALDVHDEKYEEKFKKIQAKLTGR